MVDDDDLSGIGRRELFRTGATLLAGAAIAACGNRDEPKPAPAEPAGSGAGPKHTPAAGSGAAKMTNAEAAAQTEAQAKAVASTEEGAVAVELLELTFADLEARQARGSDSAKSLVAKYVQRITAMNQAGPKLRAVIEVNPDADAIATALDGERAAGKKHGVLHGLPILVKDNVDTGDKMTTSAGSLALDGSKAAKDAFVVGKLREAGAIILGKANLSEWANFRGKLSSSGWSARGGQCRNPYALDRSPSGSSSGSAAAVAASLCAAAIGSETDGSIVSPSSCCGVVGIKPTIGLVSRAGVVPLSISQDTLGPIARTVTDAAIVLGVIAGADPDDPATTAPDKRRPTGPVDYTKFLDKEALKGARLGVPHKGFLGVHRGVDKSINLALADLRDAGAVLVDVELPIPPELGDAEIEVFLTEMKVALDKYLAARGPDAHVHSLNNVIAFNRQPQTGELLSYGQEWFEQADGKTSLTDKAYLAARAKCLKIARDQLLDKVMADHKLDAFVAPTNGPAWVIDPVNGDNSGSIPTSTLPAVAGYPHITVPGPAYHGLPIGVSFFGAPYTEGKLISFAFAYEQRTKHRRPPQYLATVDEHAD
ncbi:MAG TPA: amidase [Kofleriaceae bacterium]|nr:amidase [Kofleriaceae bacterium]